MNSARSLLLRAAFSVVTASACSPQFVEAVGMLPCSENAGRASVCLGGSGAFGGGGGVGAPGGRPGIGGTSAGGASAGGMSTGGSVDGGAASSLIHRYSFDGTGTVAVDSVSHANGTVVNATLNGKGGVAVADDRVSGNQVEDQYVDLPNQLVSPLRNATFEAWVVWNGGAPWQRIFDFGEDQTGMDGSRASSGKSYLFLTAANYPEDGSLMRLAYARVGVTEIQLDAAHALPSAALAHVAVVFDADKQTLSLYLNGALENFRPFPGNTLQQINDVNNWLGRSNFFYDPIFNGVFEEFRIYSGALSEPQIYASFMAGPDNPVLGL